MDLSQKITLLQGLELLKSQGDIGSYSVTFNELTTPDVSVNIYEKNKITIFASNLDYCANRYDEKSGITFLYHHIDILFAQCYAAIECASEKGRDF